MKICPVCSARCFDDMETCYGCLHAFADAQIKEYENEEGDDAFEEFEPEPVSDQVIQQVSKKKPSHKPPDLYEAAFPGSKHCFAAQIVIDRTSDGAIDVSVCVPSEALRLFSRKKLY